MLAFAIAGTTAVGVMFATSYPRGFGTLVSSAAMVLAFFAVYNLLSNF